MPVLDGAWSPPMLTAGDPEALAQVLAISETWRIALDPAFARGVAGERLRDALGEISEVSFTLPVVDAGLEELLAGAALPLKRLDPIPGGRPRYNVGGLKVAPGWSGPHDEPTLVIGDAALDRREWSALEAFAVGSCAPVLEGLAAGQEDSLALLEPFLDRVDAILWRSFNAGLRRSLPALRAELEPYQELHPQSSFSDARELETYLCGRGYLRYIDSYRGCDESKESCSGAPRIFLVGGARIGLPEPDVGLTERCPELIGRDYAAEVREIAANASRDAARSVSPEWSVLADRLGLISEVHAALEDICVPRRRRFSGAVIDETRRRLAALGGLLGSPDHSAKGASWGFAGGSFDVVGIGRVTQLARFDGVGLNHGIRAQARGLREWVFAAARCRHPSGELPLAALAVLAGKVSFLGYFYEEELVCGDLPPLMGRGDAAEECDVLGLDSRAADKAAAPGATAESRRSQR